MNRSEYSLLDLKNEVADFGEPYMDGLIVSSSKVEMMRWLVRGVMKSGAGIWETASPK